MKKIILAFIIFIILVPGSIMAQQSYYSIQYQIGFPMGDLGDYISQSSFRGVTVEYHGYINDNVSAGVEVGWNVFYERKDYDTYTVGNESLSGIQYRYSNHIPILITGEYTFRPGESLNPYANLGLGTIYSRRNTDMGTFTLKEDAWHFALKPEIGVIYDMNISTGFKLAVKYYTGFSAGDLDTQSYLAISGGLMFKL
jgi:outer membrane protein W